MSTESTALVVKVDGLALVRFLRPQEDDGATPMLHRVVRLRPERTVSTTTKAVVTGIQMASISAMQISNERK